jgi:paired amphipathic helix protein Sin3a
MKKNHYQENIFKFEDQRYEVDMIISILKFAIEGLNDLNDKVISLNLAAVNLKEDLGSSIIRFISRFYKDYGVQVLQGIENHPRDTIPIVINRFKKRLDDAISQKTELEKNIKISFDRFYFKSFDYRSFKFKNIEKKNNNAKAFMKEITQRKKDKQNSTNINILKGGVENFDFYTSMNLKNIKEQIDCKLDNFLKDKEYILLIQF